MVWILSRADGWQVEISRCSDVELEIIQRISFDRNTFLSRVKRTRKRDKTIQKKKRRENSREDKGRRRKASPTTALSSSSPVDFLPADNFIGTLELPNGQSVASPIKARVDDSGTSVCSLPTNMNSTDKLKVILLCGLVLSVVAEKTEEAKKTESSAQPKDEKSKRGLELSLGDHGGFGGGFGDGGFGGHGGGFGGQGGGEIISTDHIKAVTVTKHVPVPHPYPVEVTKHVPYPVKVPVKVPVDRPYPVHVPQPYPVEVTKHVPYPVEKPVPYPVKVPIKVPVKVPYPVKVPVKVPVEIAKPVPYPVKVPVVVKEPYPVVVKGHDEGGFGGGFGGGHDFGGSFELGGHDFGGYH